MPPLRHAGRGGQRDHLRGGQRAVRVDGMRLQIEIRTNVCWLHGRGTLRVDPKRGRKGGLLMSTGLIVAIVVVALLLLALLVLLPRMRAKAEQKKAQRELGPAMASYLSARREENEIETPQKLAA